MPFLGAKTFQDDVFEDQAFDTPNYLFNKAKQLMTIQNIVNEVPNASTQKNPVFVTIDPSFITGFFFDMEQTEWNAFRKFIYPNVFGNPSGSPNNTPKPAPSTPDQ